MCITFSRTLSGRRDQKAPGVHSRSDRVHPVHQRNLTLKDEVTGKIYADRKVPVKKNTEFGFARTITKIVGRPGRRS
jgi:hypothetical protein